MAERRMFAKSIIDSDAFIEMPMSARLLYYDLSMRRDDDGFVNSPRKIMRIIGATYNYIQNDRYKETNYKEQKALLTYDENKAYRLAENPCIQNVYTLETQDRLGKDRIGKDKKYKGKNPPDFEIHEHEKTNIQRVRKELFDGNKTSIVTENMENH